MSRAQPWPETVTVLRTIGTALATKRWIWRAALGEWSKVSYQAGARFHPQEYSVSSLRELAVVLDQVSRDARAFIVRGGLAPWVRDELIQNPDLLILRRKLKKADYEPSLVEIQRAWLMIDIGDRVRHQRIAAAGVPRRGSLVAAFILGRLQRRDVKSTRVLLAVGAGG